MTPSPPTSTFSIVAYDPAHKEWGVAVASKVLAVGAIVPYARAGAGAVATQSYANPTYGPEGLALMSQAHSAREVVEKLTAADERREWRQLGVVDSEGRAASFTGSRCMPWAGHHVGEHFCVQGNLLVGEEVVDAMTRTFEAARKKDSGELADWLVAALEAGDEAGGDKRGRQSAALLVVREAAGYGGFNDRYIDLRVDDHPAPVQELHRLLEIHKRVYAGSHRRR